MTDRPLSYLGIVRLGLVQTGLGAIVVLTTSTMNRVMVVEYALPAMLPGALVAFHYALQALRPRFGHGSDVARRRTPWVVGGMATLAAGGVLAAVATAWMASAPAAGIALAVAAFTLIGAGVGAAGTSLLALLSASVAPVRRGAAATIVWLMMIAGFAVTAGIAGAFLDPFTPHRLVAVTAVVCAAALLLTAVGVVGIERGRVDAPARPARRPAFRDALAEVWRDDEARRFAVFVFMSMLAYNLQDLILEPFGGTVFAMTPGETTQLAGMQHGGVLLGMLLVAVGATWIGRGRFGSLKTWTVGGCIASALALAGLMAAGLARPTLPLEPFVVALGVANGAFAVAAIGTMMSLAGAGRVAGEGVRLGVWGAAQAFAFGLGGFLGTAAIDLTRSLFADPAVAYAIVFGVEALVFLWAARLAVRVDAPSRTTAAPSAARVAAA
ncbi:BCD family MFS transporter [Acuticoccus sp.]|uniref:BCD family MFS transporter n=1 Tax=Acuticoccus sp. TaxID=1904378 RepID=UPI003B521370